MRPASSEESFTRTRPAVTIREATSADARALRRLAELDSAPPPAGRLLVAERDGRALATVPLDGGTAIADPFSHTAELITLLQLRVRQLQSGDGRTYERVGRGHRRIRGGLGRGTLSAGGAGAHPRLGLSAEPRRP